MGIQRWPARVRRWLVAACVLLFQAGAFADEVLRQFSSELLLHEGRQVLQTGKPLRYADGEAGAALRRLLDPERTAQVLDRLDAATRSGAGAPDLNQQVKPLLQRYAKAFEQWPGEYEPEYLDSLNWVVQTTKRGLAQVAAAAAAPRAGDDPAMRQLLVNSRGLLIAVSGLLERQLRDKLAANVFSPAGADRASDLAGQLAQARGELVRVRMRMVYNGRDAYERQCAVCHAGGVAGAPRPGDRLEWQRRLAGGFDALVRSTLRGKGAMPAQAGGDLQDVELARAAAWLASSGGAAIPEPELPAGHPGLVRVEEVAPIAPAPAVRTSRGEQVYAVNCAVCHFQGQRQGPFPALMGAKSLQSRDTAVRMILHGRGAMPNWRHLPDEDIAAVTNYMLERFGRKGLGVVTVGEVRRLR